jgi:hypothetical protein
MRLGEMRPRRDDAPLPDDVAAELEALDSALRGEEVPAGMESLAVLATELRAERDEPDPEFGDALDRWAAAGFPRGRRVGLSEQATRGDLGGRLRSFAQSLTLRKLAPVGAAAAALVVVVVAVAQIDFVNDDQDDAASPASQELSSGGDDAAAPAIEPGVPEGEDAAVPGAAVTEARREFDADAYQPAQLNSGEELRELSGAAARAPQTRLFVQPDSSGAAGGQEQRKVERDAQLTLAAPADEVQDVTNQAVDVVEGYRGIVLSSQSSGTDDSARATLRLILPTRTLDAALDDLSDLADVKSLSEGSVDITRPFVDAKDRLAGLRAERKSLISQIRIADTEEELDRLKVRLDGVQNQIAQANAEFENIQRRARQSSVTLQITSDGASEGDWSLEDALDDAGRVLTVGAGIALISGAVLLPLALIAAIAYLVIGASRRRARERALDE